MTKSYMVKFISADGLERTERLTLPDPVPDTYDRPFHSVGEYYADELPVAVESNVVVTIRRRYRLVQSHSIGNRRFVTYREVVPKAETK